MGSKSKRKGANGEREAVKVLKDLFPNAILVERNWAAASRPGKAHDITLEINEYAKFAVEVKRSKDRLDHNAWWRQTIEQCPATHYPLLMYRRDAKPWMVMHLALPTPSGVTLKSIPVTCPLVQWARAHGAKES